MKKSLLFALISLIPGIASAQYHYVDSKNPEILRHTNRNEPARKEIVLPQVNGYNVYKADLHTHTIFSDGNVLPDYRAKEAYLDGLDIIAVTEHLEYRPHEETLYEYMDNYIPNDVKVKNNRIASKPADSDGIRVDLNYSYNRTMKWAPDFGITVIRGTEISRDGKTIGHYNALFTQDNNKIYDTDPLVCMRNAKAQGALVMHNHPGWRKTSINYTDTDKAAYDEGLIDGVEVMNADEFYPGIIDRAIERNLFMAGCSDVHSSSAFDYGENYRPMTFIFAKDKSMESLKEAMKEGRTLAFGFNTICGREDLLKDFFKASVNLQTVREKDARGNTVLWLSNNTSLTYYIAFDGENHIQLAPFSTLIIKEKAEKGKIRFKVMNMFCSRDSHPEIELEFLFYCKIR